MANTYVLGGSPLGLINLKSRYVADGVSTFNGGRSRNVKVVNYNKSNPQATGIKNGDKVVASAVSLFSGGSLPRFWPNAGVGKIGTDIYDDGMKTTKETEVVDDQGVTRKEPPEYTFKDIQGDTGSGRVSSVLHNDTAYDTSVLNILEKLSKASGAALRPQDFAYCKYLGVYPNNRLMIARRFSSPCKDNILKKGMGAPKSILISWKPENQDFLDFTFGEEWMEADADFTNVLNKLGKDFGLDSSGTGLSKALNIIPLPGFTEPLQRYVLWKLGVLGGGNPLAGYASGTTTPTQPLPAGNPNIIKMAKRRKTIAPGEAGSGLKADFSIAMECEYEQKFISGIDPTVVWQDILNNILIFGTSNSSNYGLSSAFLGKIQKWMNNPGTLIMDIVNALKTGLGEVVQTVEKFAEKAKKALMDAIPPVSDPNGPTGPNEGDHKKQEEKVNDMIEKGKKLIKGFFNTVLNGLKNVVGKYKVEIIGIAHALSGAPSTPWHITIGNPLRPLFCSGDMLAGDVQITLGPTLAFNDLPSSIKVKFTMKNARPLGMQEILAKFNTGNVRVVNVKKDYVEDDEATNSLAKTEGTGPLTDTKQWTPTYFDTTFDAGGVSVQGSSTVDEDSKKSENNANNSGSQGQDVVATETGGSTPSVGSPSNPTNTVPTSEQPVYGPPDEKTAANQNKDNGQPVVLLDNQPIQSGNASTTTG